MSEASEFQSDAEHRMQVSLQALSRDLVHCAPAGPILA